MENNIEIWKDIDGFPSYQVSSFGKIKSLKKWRCNDDKIMKLSSDGRGYLQICLMKNKKQHTIKIHKLVAISFLNHKQNGMKDVINHIDGNKSNNHVWNLEITNQRKNMNEYFKINSHKYSSKYEGVHFNKLDSKWETQIKIGNKKIVSKRFTSEIEAALYYQHKIKELNL